MKIANIVKKETPPAMQAVAEPNPTPARAALQVFRDGELVAGQRAGHVAAQALEAARAEVATLEMELAQHEAAAHTAPDRRAFAEAKIDIDYAQQKLTEARQRVSAGEDQQRTLAQMFSDLNKRQSDLVTDILMEHARQIEAELHQIEARARERFASLTALYDHFRTEKIVGRPVEELSEILGRLRNFAIVTDDARETARAALGELLNKL